MDRTGGLIIVTVHDQVVFPHVTINLIKAPILSSLKSQGLIPVCIFDEMYVGKTYVENSIEGICSGSAGSVLILLLTWAIVKEHV